MKIFRRQPSPSKPDTDLDVGLVSGRASDPFGAARQVWNDRLGQTAASAHHWRLTALLALLIALPAVGYAMLRPDGTVYVPYAVEVDRLGNVQATRPGRPLSEVEGRLTEAALAKVIRDLRGVSVDGQLQRERSLSLYRHIADGSPAMAKVNAWFQDGNDPFLRAQSGTTGIEVQSVNAVSDTSYAVAWTETDHDRTGLQREVRRYSAILTLRRVVPTTEAQIHANPLGLFLTDLDIAEVTL